MRIPFTFQRVRFAALPLVLALGGCAFAPDSKPPAMAQPAQYGVEAAPPRAPPRGAWRSASSAARIPCRSGGSATAPRR